MDGGIVILDSFNLMPSDCVITTDENPSKGTKMKINWSEASTKRGIIWVATAIVGAVLIFMGKPIDQLLLLASGVAGGLGMMLKD